MLKVDGINVFYGDMQALWDVSFEVNENEIVVLLGSNGAGTLEIFDMKLEETLADQIVKHGIVHVPEGRRLFPEMSVEENLVMGSLAPEPKRQRGQTLEKVYNLFPG